MSAVSITELTTGDPKRFLWDDRQEAAFKKMKQLFTSAPIICHFAPELQPVVETDSTDYALHCDLSLIIERHLHALAFHSRKFNSAALNFEIHVKELVVRVTAGEEWRHYLKGSTFSTIVDSDHKNLEYFMKETRQLNHHQAQWAEFMAEFDFKIIYRPETAGGKPDALSRHP